MATNKTPSNAKWEKQRTVLKKVQLTFELMQSVDRQIRIDAAKEGESPSNVVRKILGLDVSPPQRPRLGVSLSPEELESLAERYQVDPSDKKNLVRRAAEAIQKYYQEKK